MTLQQAFTGSMPWGKVPLYLVAQVLGAIVGAGLAYLVYKKQFDEADEPENTGGIFFTGPSILSPWWNIVSEAIGTFVLLIWIQESSPFQPGTADSARSSATPLWATPVWPSQLSPSAPSLGGATGYAINPARDLGPRIMYTLLPIKGKGSSNWGYAWIPIVGPLVGVAAVVIFYNLTGAGAGSLP